MSCILSMSRRTPPLNLKPVYDWQARRSSVAALLALTLVVLATMPSRVDASTIFFGASDNTVYRINSDGSGLMPLANIGGIPTTMDVDPIRQKLYVGQFDLGKVLRMNFDGSNVESLPVPLSHVGDPSGIRAIAVDPFSQKLWLSNTRLDAIYFMGLDGADLTLWASGQNFGQVEGLDVSFQLGSVWWSDTAAVTRYFRANLDGSNPTELLLEHTSSNGLTIDPAEDLMFWGLRDVGSISVASLNGTSPSVIAAGFLRPWDVDVDPIEKRLYWIGDNDAIVSSNYDGSAQSIIDLQVPNLLTGTRTLAVVNSALPPVPEPSSLALAATGIAISLGRVCRRFRRGRSV